MLPRSAGGIFEGVDKTNGYNFIYRQHVIKPALIGLLGAWMSGGVEWNIPLHHRASTFLPVQYQLVENADGSKTIWVGELKSASGCAGRRLHAAARQRPPGGRVRILNRTPEENSMLCSPTSRSTLTISTRSSSRPAPSSSSSIKAPVHRVADRHDAL